MNTNQESTKDDDQWGPQGWYIRRGQQVRGPLSSGKIRRFVLEGRLTLDDEVSMDKASWQQIRHQDEVVPWQMREDEAADEQIMNRKRGRDRLVALTSFIVLTSLLAAGWFLVQRLDQSQKIVDVDCSAAPAPAVNWQGCRMVGRALERANLSAAGLSNAIMDDARLSESDLSRADMKYISLQRADLSYANLSNAVLLGANLQSADLTNADLRGADLTFADFTGARLGGVRLDNATLKGVVGLNRR